jgi:hypothetical protein
MTRTSNLRFGPVAVMPCFRMKAEIMPPLDKIFVGIDMADERLAVTVFRRPFDGASKPAI